MNKLLALCIAILIFQYAFAHGGGTDGEGGHHDRKSGGYHFHHGQRAHQHPNGECELSFSNLNSANYSKISLPKDSNSTGKVLLVGALGIGCGYLISRSNKK